MWRLRRKLKAVETKSSQLQIRVSSRQKAALRQKARACGLSVSEWVLALAFPPEREVFERLMRGLAAGTRRSHDLAALHDFLAKLDADELTRVLADPPRVGLSNPYDALVAAMIEHAASLKRARVPEWVLRTPPVSTPWFATELQSLRLHLLASSPPAFRRRNLFVDTSIGGRR
ncbi:MAG: hypothetical protein IPI67_33365 [Myxococcales bacterium]|nr:hypothetical protein [Myxococcales bacterium]